MVKIEKDKLKAAVSPKMILLWQKVYNSLCGRCRQRIVSVAMTNNQYNADRAKERMEEAIKKLCKSCGPKVYQILEKAKK